MMEFDEIHTPRRESRDGYIRHLLAKIFSPDEVELAMTTPTEYNGTSYTEMIYTGQYEIAVRLAEQFVDEFTGSPIEPVITDQEPALAMGG